MQIDIDREDLQSKAITTDEARAIIHAARHYSPYDQKLNDKWSLFFSVLWNTGLRLSEALALKKDDVFTDHIKVSRLKMRDRNQTDIIWIKPELYLLFINYIMEYGIKGWLFPNERREAGYIFTKLKEITQIRQHLTIHGFRHGFAFNFLAQVGQNQNAAETLTSLQRWLGHARIETTMRYTRKGIKDLQFDLRKLKF